MKTSLAIIIPAYKSTYLAEMLQSLCDQTCKDFTVYIGDDFSPFELHEIVKRYESRIDIVFRRFESNLGGNDLVAHWERCISMSIDEDWIWLFSDDDVMGNTCVEQFYKYVKFAKEPATLLHFDVDVIDMDGRLDPSHKSTAFPSHLSTHNFFKKRVALELNSYVVEYIFRRNSFFELGKFQNFDLAWCADDATWLKLSLKSGIITLPDAKVYWRFSGLNISSINDNKLLPRKLTAKMQFYIWASELLNQNKIEDKISRFDKVKWYLQDPIFAFNVSAYYKYWTSLKNVYKMWGTRATAVGLLYLTYSEIKFRVFRLKRTN